MLEVGWVGGCHSNDSLKRRPILIYHYSDNGSIEDGSRANSRNVVYVV